MKGMAVDEHREVLATWYPRVADWWWTAVGQRGRLDGPAGDEATAEREARAAMDWLTDDSRLSKESNDG